MWAITTSSFAGATSNLGRRRTSSYSSRMRLSTHGRISDDVSIRTDLATRSERCEKSGYKHIRVKDHLHPCRFRRARLAAWISASISCIDNRSVPFRTDSCWMSATACVARTRRHAVNDCSTEPSSTVVSTATGRPLFVTTISRSAGNSRHTRAELPRKSRTLRNFMLHLRCHSIAYTIVCAMQSLSFAQNAMISGARHERPLHQPIGL